MPNEKILTDNEFFTSLKHYEPLFYSGIGTPIFLINEKCYSSLVFVIVSCIVYVICIWFFSHANMKNIHDK